MVLLLKVMAKFFTSIKGSFELALRGFGACWFFVLCIINIVAQSEGVLGGLVGV